MAKKVVMAGLNCQSMAAGPFSHSVCFVPARDHAPRRRDVSPDPISYRKTSTEKRWQELFSDPSQWWDHRSEKVNSKYPDFKHKTTGQSLWLDNSCTTPWVEAELATIATGLLQSHNFSSNVRLRRHLKDEDYRKTLNLFQQMQLEGMMPDNFTFVAVLNACSNLRSLDEGRSVHKQIIQRGCQSEIYVANCLVDMYAKCGSVADAWSMEEPTRSWIEVKNLMHSFVVHDKEHPQLLQIPAGLARFLLQMNEAEFIPDTRFLSHEEKSMNVTLTATMRS